MTTTLPMGAPRPAPRAVSTLDESDAASAAVWALASSTLDARAARADASDSLVHTAVWARAVGILRAAHPRLGAYAYDILRSDRALSGADVRGKAAAYGSTYAHARALALAAWHEAGGTDVRWWRTGRRMLAVQRGRGYLVAPRGIAYHVISWDHSQVREVR